MMKAGYSPILIFLFFQAAFFDSKKNVSNLYKNPDFEAFAGYITPTSDRNNSQIFYQVFSAKSFNLSDPSKPLLV